MAEIDEQDTTRATNDAYTGMLAISLIALIVGCALLYLDYSQYPSSNPPKVTAPPPSTPSAPAPPGGAQGAGGGAQGVQQPPPMGQANPMPMPMNPAPPKQ